MRILASRAWIALTIFGIISITLFLLSAFLTLPGELHTLMQAIAEALVVSIVVALAVEPRLLQHFGEELASQTFWMSFYSRAPEEYRRAIRDLAAATQFSVAFQWKVTLDWADEQQSIIRLCSEVTSYRENRSDKSFKLVPRSQIFTPLRSPHKASIDEYSVICEAAAFYAHPLADGISKVEHLPDGRLVLRPANESALPYEMPPGQKYTIHSKATTYVGELGYTPLFITTPALSLAVQLHGNALKDLWISILHPAQGSFETKISDSGIALADQCPIRFDEVGITGQAILLYWARQPKAIVTDDRPPHGAPGEPKTV